MSTSRASSAKPGGGSTATRPTTAADAAALASLTAPYVRRYGTEYVDVPAPRPPPPPGAPPPPPEDPGSPPNPVTGNSLREMQHALRQNLFPRYDPNQRWKVPQTAAQEVGWRVQETWTRPGIAAAAATAAKKLAH